MKKTVIILITLLGLSSCLFAQFDDVDKVEGVFEENIFKSELITHPDFEEVFPGVEFYLQYSGMTRPATTRVIAIYNGKKYYSDFGENLLYDQVKDKSSATIQKRIAAVIRWNFWHVLDLKIETKELTKKRGVSPDYEFIVRWTESFMNFNERKTFYVEAFMDGEEISEIIFKNNEGFRRVTITPR